MSAPDPTPATHAGQAPLAGLRVVEVSSFVASPLCGTTLAQLGADVIRVEPLGGGPDRSRWPLSDSGQSLYWNGLNPGKRAVAVDLARPEGRALVAALVAADAPSGGVLVTNTERWPDLGYAALRSRRADVIHVLLTGRHDGGTAVDYTVQAGTGFPLVTGPENHDGPVNGVLPAWDLAAGLHLALGLLAAERRRAATGEGAEVRIALEDVALAAASNLGYLPEAQLRPDVRRTPTGNHIYGTFGRDFTSSDGRRFMLVALTPRQWSDLLRVTGLGGVVDAYALAVDADLSDEGERYRHREMLSAMIATWFAERDAATVAAALAETRVLWSPYRSFGDLAADDARLLREHPLFASITQPGVGEFWAAGSPITIDAARTGSQPAPSVGQHTHEVLADVLDLTREQTDDLAERGVIHPEPDRT